jgi:hypothetical protein
MNFNDKHTALCDKIQALTRAADELQLQQLEAHADHEAQRAARQRAVVTIHQEIRATRGEVHQLHVEHDRTKQASALSVLARLHRQGVDVGAEGRVLLGVDGPKGVAAVEASSAEGVSHAL